MLPIDDLRLEISDFSIVVSGKQAYLTTAYNIVHQTVDAVISSGQATRRIDKWNQIETVDLEIFNEFQKEFDVVKQYHQERNNLDGYSLFDLSLVLEDWEFKPVNGLFDLTHPISGTFEDQTVVVEQERPTVVGRFDVVLNLVLPPTAWALADSPNPEELRVWCSAVPGADHYNIYSDGVFLDTVPDHTKNTIAVTAGTYNVRMAAVTSGGTVGILSNTNVVEVLTSGAAIMSMNEPKKSTLEKLAFWRRK